MTIRRPLYETVTVLVRVSTMTLQSPFLSRQASRSILRKSLHSRLKSNRSINAGIQDGQNLRKQFIVTMLYSFGATSAKINRFYLLHHHKSGELTVFFDRNMKRKFSVCVCNRTYNS